MWEEGVPHGGSKCNVEFKMCRGGGGQIFWIAAVSTSPPGAFENGIALLKLLL